MSTSDAPESALKDAVPVTRRCRQRREGREAYHQAPGDGHASRAGSPVPDGRTGRQNLRHPQVLRGSRSADRVHNGPNRPQCWADGHLPL